MHPHNRLDPNHPQKQSRLTVVGVILLMIGIPCGLGGLYTIASDIMSPYGHMMGSEGRACTGMALLGIGALATMAGLSCLSFAHQGKFLRYQAGELMPVAKDVMRDGAPVLGEVVRTIASSAREGLTGQPAPGQKVRHACGAMNDPDDQFCKGCGQPLEGKFCPRCGATNDPDARFCDRCGAAIQSS